MTSKQALVLVSTSTIVSSLNYLKIVKSLCCHISWRWRQDFDALSDTREGRNGIVEANDVLEGSGQRVFAGTRAVTHPRNVLPFATRNVISAIGQTLDQLWHMIVTDGEYVCFRCLGQKSLQIAETVANRWHAFSYTTLRETVVKIFGDRYRIVFKNICECLRIIDC